MKFCSYCGSSSILMKTPAGDNRERFVCGECDRIHYHNPKIVVGCLPVWQDGRILLCQRAIAPRKGYWTIPCGFMELGETTEEGAVRETAEEANARVKITNLHTVFNLPHIDQVYMIYLANLLDAEFSAGDESLDVQLVEVQEIPWDDLAFSSIDFALRNYVKAPTDQKVHRGFLPVDTPRLS